MQDVYFSLHTVQISVTFQLFIGILSGMRQIAWFDKGLHLRST